MSDLRFVCYKFSKIYFFYRFYSQISLEKYLSHIQINQDDRKYDYLKLIVINMIVQVFNGTCTFCNSCLYSAMVFNQFQPNGISNSYQLNKSISFLRAVGWYFSNLFNFLIGYSVSKQWRS